MASQELSKQAGRQAGRQVGNTASLPFLLQTSISLSHVKTSNYNAFRLKEKDSPIPHVMLLFYFLA